MEETINQRIKRYREKSGYSQREVAELIGQKTSTYSQMERKGRITCELLLQLAEVFKTSATVLLLGEKQEQKQEPKPQYTTACGGFLNLQNGNRHIVEITTTEVCIIKTFRNLNKQNQSRGCNEILNLPLKGVRTKNK